MKEALVRPLLPVVRKEEDVKVSMWGRAGLNENTRGKNISPGNTASTPALRGT